MPYKDPAKRAECRKRWQLANPEKDRQCKLDYYYRNQEKHKVYKQSERGIEVRKKSELKMKLSGKKAASDREYYMANKSRAAFKKMRLANKKAYYLRRDHAMPKWVDVKEIQKIYQNCPADFHVDHIVPLKGKIVSGLHVPWNLQYLSEKENKKKYNKFYCEKENCLVKGD